MDVVDFRVRFRTEHMLGPWNPDDPAPHFSQYIELYKMRPRLTPMDMSEYVATMNSGGVSRGVVCGGSIEDNDHLMEVHESLDDDPFYYIAGVHPKYGVRRNLEELERCREAGFLGANISPYIWGVPANASVLYPIYAYCESHNLVAIVHGSLHYNRFQSMWLGDPKYMDEIAIDFPNLKLVISHAANGFGVARPGRGAEAPEHLPRVQRPVAAVPARGDGPGGQLLPEGPLPVRHRLPAGRVRRRRGGLDAPPSSRR